MITIKDLINKIKWDGRETPEDYVIFYYDRILKKLIHLNFKDITVKDDYILLEKNDEEINIPLHRIRKVMKKGEVIWERK